MEQEEEELTRDEIFAIMWHRYQPEDGQFARWHGAQISWLTGGQVLEDYSDQPALLNLMIHNAPQDWHQTFADSFTQGIDL